MSTEKLATSFMAIIWFRNANDDNYENVSWQGRLAIGLSFLMSGAYTLPSPPGVSYHYA
jgi:hypothetical protein